MGFTLETLPEMPDQFYFIDHLINPEGINLKVVYLFWRPKTATLFLK